MSSDREDNATADATESMAGWPAAPPPAEASDGGWNQQPPPPDSTESDATDEAAADVGTFWQETASNAWPSPPAEVNSTADQDQPLHDQARDVDTEPDAIEGTVDNGAGGEAVARAERLLDELRATIGAMGHGAGPDLSGVISDLEVAVTPPGAVAPDDVTELREALLSARERPRDLDTIINLTQRVDALLALIIAYDRAIAAIERSLDTLRRT
jgi:hypothetical protein